MSMLTYSPRNRPSFLLSQPKIKLQINQAIAAYNTAEKAFLDYETAKSKNLTSTMDLVQLRAMMNDLKNQITALVSAHV